MSQDKTLTCRECGAEFVFLLPNKIFMLKKGSQMNLAVARSAVQPVNKMPALAAAAVAIVPNAKCIKQLVQLAV